MNDFVKAIERYEIIKSIYDNDLFTSESIAKKIGIWDNLTESEKESLQKNKPIEKYLVSTDLIDLSEDEQNTKLGYGELTIYGVEKLYEFLVSKIDSESSVNFCDIGSGNGKLILHLSYISNFNNLIGLEINKLRNLYAEWTKNTVIFDFNNVEFLHQDALSYDFSDINVVFMNDVLFERQDIDSIISKLNPGTHLVSIEPNDLLPLDDVSLQVSWMADKINFKYYRIGN